MSKNPPRSVNEFSIRLKEYTDVVYELLSKAMEDFIQPAVIHDVAFNDAIRRMYQEYRKQGGETTFRNYHMDLTQHLLNKVAEMAIQLAQKGETK